MRGTSISERVGAAIFGRDVSPRSTGWPPPGCGPHATSSSTPSGRAWWLWGCGRAEDWPWSSARAHLEARGDGLVAVTPLLGMIGDWRAFLSVPPADEDLEQLRRHQRTGRPLGGGASSPAWNGPSGAPYAAASRARGPRPKIKGRAVKGVRAWEPTIKYRVQSCPLELPGIVHDAQSPFLADTILAILRRRAISPGRRLVGQGCASIKKRTASAKQSDSRMK